MAFNDPWNRLLNYAGTPLEHRYLAFFQHQTAPILSGYFDSYFWNGLLLQVGHSEPTIQHAMMAVASIHEQVENAGNELFCLSQGDHGMNFGRYFALQQYNKAIYCLNQRLAKGPQSEEITLMCCVLFICLEFLRGNIDTAISHVQSGLEIMAGWRAKNRKWLLDEALPVTSEPHSIPDNLVQMFSRLSIQSMLCDQKPPTGNPLVSAFDLVSIIPALFPSLQAARASLDFLMKISLAFLQESHEPDFRMKPETKPQLDNLTNALDKWSLAFEFFLINSPATRTHQEIRATANLRILNIVAKVWLSSSVSVEESVFDDHTQAFSNIVNIAATINSDSMPWNKSLESASLSNSQANRPHKFTFEMGVIPPLYFVAMKCRVPSIRRAAISLLNTTMPRREGIWIASFYVAVAKRIIELEEENLQAIGHKDEQSGELLPPERRRVHNVKIHSRAEEHLTQRIQKVTIMMRPDGPEGLVYEQDEVLKW